MLAQCCKHDQTMEPQIGGFVDDIAAVTADGGIFGGDDGFDRLFAHLLQNLVQPLVVETGDVGGVGSRALALFEYLRKARQGISHVQCPAL